MSIDYEARRRQQREDRLLAVADFYTRPLYWLADGLQMMLIMVGIILFLIGSPIFWYFHGPKARAAANETMKQSRYILEVDFRTPQPYQVADRDAEPELGMYPSKWVAAPFGVRELSAAEGLPPLTDTFAKMHNDRTSGFVPIEFCDLRAQDNFEHDVYTEVRVPRHWKFWNQVIFNDMNWAKTKSIPMYIAYARAAYSLTRMRIVMATLQHRNWNPMDMPSPCDSDFKLMTVNEEQSAIKLPDAPVVNVAYTLGESVRTPGDQDEVVPRFLITGMCLPNECSSEDFELINNRDLSGPSFTDHQRHAMEVLAQTSDPEYWVKVSRANGINYDVIVRTFARLADKEAHRLYPDPVY